MSLIECKACGKEISTEARACPHCGHPSDEQLRVQKMEDKNTQSNQVGCMLVGIVIVIVGYILVMNAFK